MLYYSTANPRHRASLIEAITRGLPPDGGYYMPERIPYIPSAFFRNMGDMSLKDIGYVVANSLFGEDIPAAVLKQIVTDAIDFDTPLLPLAGTSDTRTLELFHGPSHSYKDFGARFMARMFRNLHLPDKRLNILVASTGDAGDAVANAFRDIPGTRVFILYPRTPSGNCPLSSSAAAGSNIIPVEVRGTFSQCHDLVKEAFADRNLASRLNLFAANSFNLARLLPQTIYYFYAYARLLREDVDTSRIVIAVPAGNLGNLTAGLIAKQMGLPAKRIIAARSDGPDPFDDLIHLHRRPARLDDPAIPPNFWRLLALYNGNIDLLALDADSSIVNTPSEPGTDPATEAARAALEALDPADASVKILFATSHPEKHPALQQRNRAAIRPAAVIPPSQAAFRRFLLDRDKSTL